MAKAPATPKATPAQPWAAPKDAPEQTPAGEGEGTDTDEQAARLALEAEQESRREMEADVDALTAAERAVFETFMLEQAKVKLSLIKRTRESDALVANFVDGTKHYGTLVPTGEAEPEAE